MSRRFIVLRGSPDWKTYDLEQSREFCLRTGLPETTILDFVAIWDSLLRVDYRTFRQRLKDISLATFASVVGAEIVTHLAFRDVTIKADDLIAFTDDDDWYAPDLFEVETSVDGARWGSIRVGRPFRAEVAQDNEYPILIKRPIDTAISIFTNNYIVSGRALIACGLDGLFEHGSAQAAQDQGAYQPHVSSLYLSCANKTPASGVSARFLLEQEAFRRDPLREFQIFAGRFMSLPTDLPDWMRSPFKRYADLVRQTMAL